SPGKRSEVALPDEYRVFRADAVGEIDRWGGLVSPVEPRHRYPAHRRMLGESGGERPRLQNDGVHPTAICARVKHQTNHLVLLARLVTGGATEDERSRARHWLFQLASARGRLSLAARVFDGAMVLRGPAIFAGLFEGGDSATASRARKDATGSLRPDSVMSRC